MELSVVIPVYNEAASLEELYFELVRTIGPLKNDYELIFVNDGSSDGSCQELRDLAETAKESGVQLSVISFSKNLGKSAAFKAGFARARGDIIVTLDADLQDDPADIPLFFKALEKGYDMVSGWRHNRQDFLGRKIASSFFNAVVRMMTKTIVHDSVGGFKAYKKNVAKNLNLVGGFYRFIPVIVAAKGFMVGEVLTSHRKRKYGRSKFGVMRYGAAFFDFIVLIFIIYFFRKPLRFF
jgi:glycosyltransferase involved in cell wall biosynthesis